MQSSTRNLVIYYFLLCLFLVFLLELGSYFVLKGNDQGVDTETSSRHVFHPYRTHALNINYSRSFDSGGKKLHSDDGFRSDTTFTKDKPENVYRIIMLGGSTLYGIGATGIYPSTPTLNNEQTISHYLDTKLKHHVSNSNIGKDGKRIEVINAAVVAYTTFQHLVYFNEVLFEYDPDLVVFLDGHNDFYYYEQYNNWQNAKQGTPKLTYHFNERTFWFTGISVTRYLAQYSRFFMLLEKYMMRVWSNPPPEQYPQSAFARTVDSNFPGNIDDILSETIFKSYVQFQALGKLFDFETIVFLQPQVVLENSDLLSPEDKNIQTLTLQSDTNTQRSELRSYLPGQFEKYKLKFVDIAEIADKSYSNKQLYTDYCHLTAVGSEAVAERMFPHLLPFFDTTNNN